MPGFSLCLVDWPRGQALPEGEDDWPSQTIVVCETRFHHGAEPLLQGSGLICCQRRLSRKRNDVIEIYESFCHRENHASIVCLV